MVYILIGLSMIAVSFFCAFVKSRILKIWKILAPLLVVIEGVHVPQLICSRSSHYANQRQPELALDILLSPHRFLGYVLKQFLSMRWSCGALTSPLLLHSPLAAAVVGTQFFPESFSHLKGRKKHQNVLRKVWDCCEYEIVHLGFLEPLF